MKEEKLVERLISITEGTFRHRGAFGKNSPQKENYFYLRKLFYFSSRKANPGPSVSRAQVLHNKNQELKEKLSKLASKPVTLYNKNGSIHSQYSGIRIMARYFKCCNKT
jgi:hypothetical protein